MVLFRRRRAQSRRLERGQLERGQASDSVLHNKDLDGVEVHQHSTVGTGDAAIMPEDVWSRRRKAKAKAQYKKVRQGASLRSCCGPSFCAH